MAYFEKYYVNYCDPQKNSYRLSIMEEGFVGAPTLVVAGPIPFALHIENSNELKTGGISPTRAVITLVSSPTFDMDELYTTDELKYKIVHKREDDGPLGYWEGFVIPTGLTEEMDNNVHYIEIQASDRLSSLQGIKFLDASGENYGMADGIFDRSFLFVIKECLKKTGLNLPIRTLVDIQPMVGGTPQSGGIFADSVYFWTIPNGNADRLVLADPSGTFEDTLSVGCKINVSGGLNDGKEFTVDGWSKQPGTVGWLEISVSPAPIATYPWYEDCVLTVMNNTSTISGVDPLDIAYHDVRTYIDRDSVDEDPDKKWLKPKPYYEFTDGTMMCWKVLEAICTLWNVRLMQNGGWWEIRRWNAEAIEEGTYEWFQYNSNGEYSGRSPFGRDIVFYCKHTSDTYLPFGHTKSMDRVFKRVTTRYTFRYKQEGDSLVNLIRDGNFSQLGTDQPKWMSVNDPGPLDIPLGPYVTQETSGLPAGFTTGLRYTGYSGFRALTNTMNGYTIEVLKGDRLMLTLWERIDGTAANFAGVYDITLENIVMGNRGQINVAQSKYYDLVNASGLRKVSQRESGFPEYYYAEGKWEERVFSETSYLKDRVKFITVYGNSGVGVWRKIDIDLDEMPASGILKIDIIGIATLSPTSADRSFNGFPMTQNVIKAFAPVAGMAPRGGGGEPVTFELSELRLVSFRNSYPALLVTGMFMSRVTTGEDRERDYIGFMYEQNGNYTDTIEDIDIMNADVEDDDHIGMIRVKNSGELIFTDRWDTWGHEFGWDSLAMLLSRSVMQNYLVPMRKIDGDFVAPELDFGSRIFIERTGGAKYVMLRGSINYIRNRFSGTLVQIGEGSYGPPTPPPIDKDPDWQPNGITRCQRSPDDSLNTGFVEVQYVDVNTRSNTYMQTVWRLGEQDTDMCPVGLAQPLYWGAVLEGQEPDPAQLQTFPYDLYEDYYTVEYSNDGTGKFLMVYFLESLGDLRHLLEIEGEESISSWEAMDDVEINGLIYKGYRMSYVTGVFTGHPKTFVIN